MRSYTSEGIVLSKKNLGEADKILIVYTKNHGKVSLIAKGVRRPKSRKRGHIEVFNKVVFQAQKTHSLDLVTEVEVIEDFYEIRKNLKKVSLAYYFCEVINKITNDSDVNPQVYDILKNSLENLKSENKLKNLRFNFIHKLLSILGFWPEDKLINDYDQILDEVIERQLTSVRVGKSMLE